MDKCITMVMIIFKTAMYVLSVNKKARVFEFTGMKSLQAIFSYVWD